MKLTTVYTHPRWIAAATKLNDLNGQASKLRSRASELEAVIESTPASQSVSLEALQLLGDALDGGHVSALQAGKSARVELAEIRKRLATLQEAVTIQQTRMSIGSGDGNSLARELADECCRTAGPEFIKRMRNVLSAAQSLQNALKFADDIPQTLTSGGGGYISDPIRLEYGPFVDIRYLDGNVMSRWLERLTEYINTMEPAANAA